MSIAEYFENAKGQGILATADKDGNVDAAVYAKPKILEENTIAFIMRDSLTHANVKSNLHACYLFVENEGGGYRGLRLYLSKLYEEEDSERLHILRRADHNCDPGDRGTERPSFPCRLQNRQNTRDDPSRSQSTRGGKGRLPEALSFC